MKILEELWYGNVTPGERGVEKDGRLWNLGRLILQNEEELAPLLSEKVLAAGRNHHKAASRNRQSQAK